MADFLKSKFAPPFLEISTMDIELLATSGGKDNPYIDPDDNEFLG